MSKDIKRFVSLILTGVLAVSCLAGCGSKKDTESQKEENKAMGRYLESDVSLPENISMAYSMKMMEDGSILLAASDSEAKASVWKLNDDEASWEKLYDVDSEQIKDGKYTNPYISGMAISPKGDALAMAYLSNEEDESGEDYKTKYYHIDETGTMTEVPYETQSYNYFLQCDDNGNFYMSEGDFSVRRVNVETGESEIIVDSESKSYLYGIAGNTLYSASSDGTLSSYDLESNELIGQDDALNESIKESGISTTMFSTTSMPILFTGTGGEDTMFYCGKAGVYRHVKDGNVSERLIDGSLTSLSNPDLGFISLEVTEDEVIYVLATGSEGNSLMKYTYSADTPSVPEKELTAYTLYDSPEVVQAISMYQKENPEVYVKLEVGVTEDNGVTPSDALRTLSTEIMAGNGPDLLLLDGMPLDSYIEKGMLEDVSDIVKEVDEEEGLFTNITSAFEEDGKVCAVPLRFHMPVLEGEKESLENVKDLKTLVDEAERLHGANPDKPVISDYLDGTGMAVQLYDVCSAAWMKDDGTIDEEKLQEFYTQLQRIYSIDERSNNEYNFKSTFVQSVSSIGAGALQMYCDKNNINFGNISTPMDLTRLTTTMADRENIGYDLLDGQTENTYLPSCIAGINSKGDDIEAVRDFLKYLLGKSAQATNQGNGMPVNKQGMEDLVLGKSLEGYSIAESAAGDEDTYIEMTFKKITDEDYQFYLEKVEKLETSALSNAIIRDAVLEQANDCATGAITVEDAVKKVVEKINLYLAEG